MKKTLLLSLILLSGILLTACGKKDEEPTQNIEPVEIIENNDCEGTIQDYLDGANKQ
jgi:major membrane immunogen (membrane-anchored lipoprotein)